MLKGRLSNVFPQKTHYYPIMSLQFLPPRQDIQQ